jgi:hypothetical protein
MHLEGNAAKWWQAFKQHHKHIGWQQFCLAVVQEFGSDDYRNAVTDIVALKQIGTVEDYATQFQTLQFTVMMHTGHADEVFYTAQFISGLKDEIRAIVEPQRPSSVQEAAIIAKIQQGVLDRSKLKYQRNGTVQKPNPATKLDNKTSPPTGISWQDHQLRNFRRANNLCYGCGGKYEPGHEKVCPKRNPSHSNALVVNDLDRELLDDVLNQMELEDTLQEQFCQLSLNAISSKDHMHCIKLKTKLQDKVMLVLVDSGSSHNFISSAFVKLANLPTTAIPPRQVQLANTNSITAAELVPQMNWYC